MKVNTRPAVANGDVSIVDASNLRFHLLASVLADFPQPDWISLSDSISNKCPTSEKKERLIRHLAKRPPLAVEAIVSWVDAA